MSQSKRILESRGYMTDSKPYGPNDVCKCGHYRGDHAGIGNKYPGACSVCASIDKCAHFAFPLK